MTKWGEISCQFLPPGGSMGPRYVLHVKNHKIAKNSTTTKAREKISTDLGSLEFYIFFTFVWLNLKAIKFYFSKLATYFYWQPSYVLDVSACSVATATHFMTVSVVCWHPKWGKHGLTKSVYSMICVVEISQFMYSRLQVKTIGTICTKGRKREWERRRKEWETVRSCDIACKYDHW